MVSYSRWFTVFMIGVPSTTWHYPMKPNIKPLFRKSVKPWFML